MKAIVNGRLILKDCIIDNKVIIFDNTIISIQDDMKGFSDLEIIDAKGCYVSPGFIDVHVHGGYGHDVMDGTAEAVDSISQGLVSSGVTSFLPTTISMSKDNIDKSLSNIRYCMETQVHGARIIGVHLEGPFINPVRKGAHDARYIIKPDLEIIKEHLNVIKIITVAPEMDKNLDFINNVCKHTHVSLSIGHSDATYEEAVAAIRAGVKSATHLYNAMSGLSHRNPGVVEAALNNDIYCELIADDIHVHPAMYKIAAALKGSDRIILITDAIRACCLKEGVYELGGQDVTVREGSARLEDGTLAGSVLRLNSAISNFRRSTGLPLHEIIKMVSLNPARLLGWDHKIGSLEAGKISDITIFDEDLNIQATIINGELNYIKS